MTEQIMEKVVVHKALLSLNTGESVYEFTDALREAARMTLSQKLNLSDKDYMYVLEIFSDKVVVQTSTYSTTGSTSKSQTFAYTYKRENGKFTFDNKTEVKRVTRYEPVQKNKDGSQMSPREVEETHKGAWAPVAPLWSGVV